VALFGYTIKIKQSRNRIQRLRMGKSKNRKSPAVSKSLPESLGFFPFAQYTSVVGVHIILLLFTTLFLPRTTFLLTDAQPTQTSSRDRPQHPFLEPLTTNPLLTVTYICAGASTLQLWWCSWIRKWWMEFTSTPQALDDKMRLESKTIYQRTYAVRHFLG